jgi:DNA-binding MarR family transcriptional regulator
MTNLVDQYFAVLEKVGYEDFQHPDLEVLRLQMSEEDRRAVRARLTEESKAAIEEAEELEEFAFRKIGLNDNSSS